MAFDPNTLVRHYGDPAEEVDACRTSCALFDFSFIARARVRGPDAAKAVGQLTRRRLDDLPAGRICYAVREDPSGCLHSDLTIWRHHDGYEVMSGRTDDIVDLMRAAPRACNTEDPTAATSIFSIQGPRSLEMLSELADIGMISKLSYFEFTAAEIHGVPCLVGRLGYTGEAGFEIVLPQARARAVWDLLAQKARPAGFIAADILRIEAGFVLFANEFRVPVTAREAGLERFAGPQARTPSQITLVCFHARTHDKPLLWQPTAPLARPARSGEITITSACHSRAAEGTLGLGFALQSDIDAGVPLADPHGAFSDIRLVSRPFVDAHKRRPRAAWGTGSVPS